MFIFPIDIFGIIFGRVHKTIFIKTERYRVEYDKRRKQTSG